jgi:hypothetical protein
MRADCRRLALATAATALIAGSGVQAQTLTMGVIAGPESIDPHYTATGTHSESLKHVFDTLTHSGDRLQIEPGLAETWRVINPTTWEFRLRRDVKFHDGSDMTAEDVAASIRRMQVLSGPNPTRIYVRRVQEVRIVDSHTIHVVTDGPAPTLPNDFIRVFVTSARATAGLTPETSNEAFNSGRAAIGTGPYRFVSWTPREQFTVERNDAWWGPRQPWARHVRREISNPAARVAQLRTGQVDMIVRVPRRRRADARARPQPLRAQDGDGLRVQPHPRPAGEHAAGHGQGRLAPRRQPLSRPARAGSHRPRHRPPRAGGDRHGGPRHAAGADGHAGHLRLQPGDPDPHAERRARPAAPGRGRLPERLPHGAELQQQPPAGGCRRRYPR